MTEKYKSHTAILEFLHLHPSKSSKEIFDEMEFGSSYASLKRELSFLVNEKLVSISGKGKSTNYSISNTYQLFYPINIDEYFEKDIDDRKIKNRFDLQLMSEVLMSVNLFDDEEQSKLEELQKKFEENYSKLSKGLYNKEMERLAIDLSWKSSQIEGNIYSLMETERLLKEKLTAEGKTKDDATMLLNHKEAIDFLIENKDYLYPLYIGRIEDIHSILIKELEVDRNIRKGIVRISGTNYVPLDNEFQIKEALYEMCRLINKKVSIFEKSFLALILLSYIQPFTDGNKRTARIVSNGILIANNHCPISFRTVDSLSYKKAMLIFYEQNNLQPMKQIFIDQYEFAVANYF